MKRLIFLFLAFFATLAAEKLPELTPQDTVTIYKTILDGHATYKKLSNELVKRTLSSYLDYMDPLKIYFLETEVNQWLQPSEEVLSEILADCEKGRFTLFFTIDEAMVKAIDRRRGLEADLEKNPLEVTKSPFPKEKIPFAKNLDELKTRLAWLKSEEKKAASHLLGDQKEKILQRIAKRRASREEEIATKDPRFIYSTFLKAFSQSLDTHTAYLTPAEASQFMIQVQQRLFGIGVQLRDDLNGFSVLRIIEGSPASKSTIKVNDRIIAVNGEPTIGMDIVDVVELIRGEEGTKILLTVMRKEEGNAEEKIDIEMTRSEVVIKEARIESNFTPYADGVIGVIQLHGFFQDGTHSSSSELYEAIEKISKEGKLKGLILDLRDNTGGILPQAVSVTGLFITRGVVVAIKDGANHTEFLREIGGKTAYDGPLIVLVNKSSASAAEIVAGALQDYGRALIVGDEHTFGKGTFQTLTMDASSNKKVNPKGEFKVTRGRYYTVSGKSPQLHGVIPDIIVPGPLASQDIGESFGKFPLPGDSIPENFKDDLSDLPAKVRDEISPLYRFNLQPKIKTYTALLPKLKENSEKRMKNDPFYQTFNETMKKEEFEPKVIEVYLKADPQLKEGLNIMKDMISLLN